MNLSRVSPGDIVRVDHKGRVFLAVVDSKEPQLLRITPITSGITYHEAKAREVKALWKRTKAAP